MAIRFACDSCGKALKADESKAGKRVKCPGCDDVVTIPEPEAPIDQFDEFDTQDYGDQYDDDNPFAAPKTKTVTKRRASTKNRKLAGRGTRFVGAILDGFVGLGFMLPAFIWYGVFWAIQGDNFDHDSPGPLVMVPSIILFLVGVGLLVGFNIYLMSTRGQSIAKYLLKMQILNIETDQPAGFVKIFLVSGFLNGLIGNIPFVGLIYGIADPLFIFGDDRRCLHDRLAGTYVVDIS